MTLIIDELYDGITFVQNFRIKQSISIAHVRPWIYKQGTIVDGDLTLEIYEGATLLKSVSINYLDINAGIPATYAHGQIRFDFDPLQLNHDRSQEWTEYTMKLYMANHSTNTANFIGTSRRYESQFYDTYGSGVINGQAANDMVEPLGFEIYRYTY